MRTARPSRLTFSGARGGTGPLTWAQRFMADQLRGLPGQEEFMLLVTEAPVPAGSSEQDVSRALGALVERHEALRTVVESRHGLWWQRVVRTGSMPVDHVAVDRPKKSTIDDLVAGLRQRYARLLFGSGWAFRACVVWAGDTAHSVLLFASHLLCDAASAELIRADCAALLAGEPLGAPGLQPLDLARIERSDAGRAINRDALARAGDEFLRAPARRFTAGAAPGSGRFLRCELVSPAAAAAVRVAARRIGAPMSAVALAVLSAVFARFGDHDRIMVNVVSSNRLTRELIDYPAYLTQVSPLVVDDVRGSVPALARRLSRDLIVACRHGRYCPAEMAGLESAISRQRGVTLGQDLVFNFLAEPPTRPPAGHDAADADHPREATSFSWTDNRVIRRDVRVFTDIVVGTALRLTFRVNTEFVAPELAEAMAFAVESALVELTSTDLDVARIAPAIALSPQ